MILLFQNFYLSIRMFFELFYEYFFGPLISALIMTLFLVVTHQVNKFISFVERFRFQRKQRLEREAKWKRVQEMIDWLPEAK